MQTAKVLVFRGSSTEVSEKEMCRPGSKSPTSGAVISPDLKAEKTKAAGHPLHDISPNVQMCHKHCRRCIMVVSRDRPALIIVTTAILSHRHSTDWPTQSYCKTTTTSKIGSSSFVEISHSSEGASHCHCSQALLRAGSTVP